MTRLFGIVSMVILLAGCADDNSKAVFGKETKLPVNCRAYVQFAIDGYRNQEYDENSLLDGLERNCGEDGQIWKDNR